MPIYEEEGRSTREELYELRRYNKCKECGGMLNVFVDYDAGKAFLACNDWPRSHHEGIEREASRYQKEGLASLNINTRREIMEKEYGKGTTTALDKARLPTSGALTQSQAMHILRLVYPEVPDDQIIRTAILCRDFGLHPLMKEVYILGFKNNKTGKTDYSTVIGIGASRKMAANKKGTYSYLDDTPRTATQEEIIKQYGQYSEEEKDNLISICKVKGEKGNEAIGFGLWPKDKIPYGMDKGNTRRNMANIRSERPALDRLPGESLPQNVEVIDEAYVELPEIGKIEKATGEIIEQPTESMLGPNPKEHWCQEHNCAFELKSSRFGQFYSHKLPGGGYCKEDKKGAAPKPAPKAAPHIPESTSELPSDEPEPEPEAVEEESQLAGRDPETIRTLNDLYKACNQDFKNAEGEGMQPGDVVKALGYSSQTDISDTPSQCYIQIRAVRQ